MKRLLLLHISQYGGHKKASENLEEAFRFREPSLDIKNINGFGYVTPRLERCIDFFYMLTIKHAPFIWGSLYDRKTVVKAASPLQNIVNIFAIPKIYKLLNDYQPGAILATQAFPCRIAGDIKKKYKLDIPLIAVVTDYYPHRFWIHPQISIYTVACQEAKQILVKEGVPQEKIKVAGIPISYQFSQNHPREAIAAEFGFAFDTKTIMIMGGGLGIGPIKQIIKLMEELPRQLQLIVVCGRNKKLYEWVSRKKFRKKIFAYGYVDFINKLMDFSDILITKGGGLTISEALTKGIGTLVVNPIPGQEDRNVRYLENRQAIIRITNLIQIPVTVNMLLNNPRQLSVLKESAKQTALSDAALHIADVTLNQKKL
ncbi:MAG: hypothetical protein JXD21_07800 [Candidatus Omnitrophica bacterium]|nr:hypothetical protein [Candidatus Omnitrophota bacterium]